MPQEQAWLPLVPFAPEKRSWATEGSTSSRDLVRRRWQPWRQDIDPASPPRPAKEPHSERSPVLRLGAESAPGAARMERGANRRDTGLPVAVSRGPKMGPHTDKKSVKPGVSITLLKRKSWCRLFYGSR